MAQKDWGYCPHCDRNVLAFRHRSTLVGCMLALVTCGFSLVIEILGGTMFHAYGPWTCSRCGSTDVSA